MLQLAGMDPSLAGQYSHSKKFLRFSIGSGVLKSSETEVVGGYWAFAVQRLANCRPFVHGFALT
jgi:hypothetical protein